MQERNQHEWGKMLNYVTETYFFITTALRTSNLHFLKLLTWESANLRSP
jgi:hypothetical protein